MEGTKPLSWHTAGSANIPAPTVVPATSAMAPGNDPGSCRKGCLVRFKLDHSLSLSPLVSIFSIFIVAPAAPDPAAVIDVVVVPTPTPFTPPPMVVLIVVSAAASVTTTVVA